MNKEIIYKDLSNGDVTVCKDLCNKLMQHQTNMTTSQTYKKILSTMHFDNRLKPKFDACKEKQLIVAYDGEKPVGYVFSTAEVLKEENGNNLPSWAPKNSLSFTPTWLECPVKTTSLSNLYVLPEYRGLGIGRALTDSAMKWLEQSEDAKYIFVYVSHNNDVVPFYKSYGFTYSHDVLGGMIQCYYKKVQD